MRLMQRIKQMLGLTSVAQPTRDKLVFSSLFNSFNKKLAFCFVLFFGYLSLSDWSVWIYKPPNFNQLNITEGEIFIGWAPGRGGRPLYLIVNGEKVKFNCELKPDYGNGCQFNKTKRLAYQGKQGKVWWYRTSSHGWIKDNRLYKLDIEGKEIVSYQHQVDRYLKTKQHNSYIFFIFLILASLFFCILQLENQPINTKEKRN